MMYIPKAVYDILTVKQQEQIAAIITDLQSSYSREFDGFKSLYILTEYGRVSVADGLVLIPNNLQNTKMIDLLIGDYKNLLKNETELERLRKLEESIAHIKECLK